MGNLSNKNIEKPLVSISCITYNHAPFLKQCLDGFLMQKTNFVFEILIHDDVSTDGTKEIIEEYSSRYPDIFFPMFQKENQYSTGLRGIGIRFNLPRCRGKYIALCEGDDYWTDENKLQKQVDFLEANPDCNISFHRANLLTSSGLAIHEVPLPNETTPFFYEELLRHYNFITTASVMFRKPENFIVPDWFKSMPFTDLALYKVVSQDKKIACINEIMSVYRIHENGIWSGLNSIEAANQYLYFYKKIYLHLNSIEKRIVSSKIKNCIFKISKLKFAKSAILLQFYYRFSLIKFIKYL